MAYKRKMKRYSKLVPQVELVQQLVDEKGYRQKEVKMFLKDLNEILVENLSCGNSVHLLPGLYLEVMQHPGQMVYSFREKKNVKQDPYPILYCRMTAALKDRVFAAEDEFSDDGMNDKYGYED